MGAIDWSGFTWEAFATLVTGLAAVGAALVVGLRQLGIADRQREILERQVGFDEMKLRADLFDRRFRVYEATLRLVVQVVQRADKADSEIERDFAVALDQSRLLFKPAVHAALKRIWDDYCNFCAVKSIMKANYEQKGDYGKEQIEAGNKYFLKVGTLVQNLTELFGDELSLGER